MGLRRQLKKLPFMKRKDEKKMIFQPCSGSLFSYTGITNPQKATKEVYLPAFNQIFLLLSAFYCNGLRGDIYEFGVFRGFSAHLFAECMKRFQFHAARLHLFDSFEGLPSTEEKDLHSHECREGIWKAGAMKVEKNLDVLLHNALSKELGEGRVSVVKGFFDQTLPDYFCTVSQKALLIHLDCDLYSSSKYVLNIIMEKKLLQEGTILICDDWMCSFGSPQAGQRKALAEIQQEYPQWQFEPYLNYGIGSQAFIVQKKASL